MAEEKVSKKEESEARKEFRKIMDAYEKRNPVKFALKKEELEKKLAAIA